MKKTLLLLSALSLLLVTSCGVDGPESTETVPSDKVVYVLNEGGYGQNNASLSQVDLETGAVTNDLFSKVNGEPLGDTANDILVTGDRIIMAVNGSNLIQFCNSECRAVAAVEVPSCRKMATDGKYLYVTSYAGDGTVYKIDLSTYKVVSTAKVGYEPEGIAIYGGKLYVANSGGYAYLGTHGYEDTISIVDAASMETVKTVECGMFNLYGAFLQNSKYPQYILVNAAGDYMSNPAGSFIFDCESEKVAATYDFPATYAAQYEGTFFALGSSFSYATYTNEYTTNRIEMRTDAAGATSPSLESWVIRGIEDMVSPYGIYITNNGNLFVGDAGDYSSRGSIYRYDVEGKQLSKETVGVCPGHFASR